MLLTYVLFFIGFAVLIKGADWLVDGASSLAKRLDISTLVIGLTIVAFGTSAPELVVNILASIAGNSDIAIGNILGSNIANILLVLGISAAIYPLAVTKGTVWKDIPFSLLAVIVLTLMVNDAAIDNGSWSGLSRIDGLILIAFFMVFLYYLFSIRKTATSVEIAPHLCSLTRSCLMVSSGLVALVVGGKWIVDGAAAIASSLGISEALIGLTVVAVGTSLPEMATSAVAAYKKNTDIAIGNIVGSNIFNIFWILGVSATIRPLPFSQALMSDMYMTVAVTFLLFVFMFVGKRRTLQRWQGVCFIAFYVTYITYLVIRG